MTEDYGPGYVWPPTRRLENIARELAAEWALPLGERFTLSRFGYAAPLGDHVLKITPPEDDEADHEADALLLWAGDGAVRVLRHDRARRALLLERARPGHDASTIDSDAAIGVALDVARRLWRPAGAPFRRARDEVTRWLAAVAASGHPYVPLAQRIFASLEPRAELLVHGDYHHHNLLRHGESWIAIDPKPLIAEPEFDVVTLLWNPLGELPTAERTERHLAQMSAAGLDEERIRAWAIVRGTYLGLPLPPGDDGSADRQLTVVRHLLAAPAPRSAPSSRARAAPRPRR